MALIRTSPAVVGRCVTHLKRYLLRYVGLAKSCFLVECRIDIPSLICGLSYVSHCWWYDNVLFFFMGFFSITIVTMKGDIRGAMLCAHGIFGIKSTWKYKCACWPVLTWQMTAFKEWAWHSWDECSQWIGERSIGWSKASRPHPP